MQNQQENVLFRSNRQKPHPKKRILSDVKFFPNQLRGIRHEFRTGAIVGEMAHIDFLEPPIASVPNDCLGGAIDLDKAGAQIFVALHDVPQRPFKRHHVDLPLHPQNRANVVDGAVGV